MGKTTKKNGTAAESVKRKKRLVAANRAGEYPTSAGNKPKGFDALEEVLRWQKQTTDRLELGVMGGEAAGAGIAAIGRAVAKRGARAAAKAATEAAAGGMRRRLYTKPKMLPVEDQSSRLKDKVYKVRTFLDDGSEVMRRKPYESPEVVKTIKPADLREMGGTSDDVIRLRREPEGAADDLAASAREYRQEFLDTIKEGMADIKALRGAASGPDPVQRQWAKWSLQLQGKLPTPRKPYSAPKIEATVKRPPKKLK